MEQTPTAPESQEQLRENALAQLELRLLYAQAVSEKSKKSLSQILLRGTDLHARIFGFIPSMGKEGVVPMWWNLAQEIDRKGSTHAEQLKVIDSYYQRYNKESKDHTKDPYWPFRYDPPGEDGAVSIHFGSMLLGRPSVEEGPGLLSSERLEEQRAKLKAMFTEIKYAYPDAKEVRGGSWLYGRKEYCRLYPPSYTEHLTPRKTGDFVGGGTWGQFRKSDGSMDENAREQFIKNLEKLDVNDLRKVFPTETLIAKAPIEDFYKFYGIE